MEKPFKLLPHHRLFLLAVSLHLLLPLHPLTPSRFFNRLLAVSEPGALNCYTFFCLIASTLFVSRNLTLTHRFLYGFLDSLLCDLIAPTPGLAFSLQMPRTLTVASLFLSGKAHLSLNFLPPLFLRLTPTLITCRGQHLSKQLLLALIPSCLCSPYLLFSNG